MSGTNTATENYQTQRSEPTDTTFTEADASGSPLQRFSIMAIQDEVKVGLVGFGLFGRHHAAAITRTPGTCLSAIAVKSAASREAAREAHPDSRIYSDYREMLAKESLDLVDVVVPNQLHFEVGQAALAAGMHLFIEKPMAVQRSQCDQLVQQAKQGRRLLAVNHELRLSPLWGGVKSLIDQGKIGTPLYALVELSRFPYRQGSEGWRYDIQRVGNWILEEPIHFFDLACWYLEQHGEPHSVYALANSRQDAHPELQDNFSALVKYRSGAYAMVSQTLAAFEHHVTAKITGSEGTVWAHWSAADARSDKPTFGLRYGLGDQIETVEFEQPTGELVELADHIRALVRCLREDLPPPCSGHDGRRSATLCLAAQESVETGLPVVVGPPSS